MPVDPPRRATALPRQLWAATAAGRALLRPVERPDRVPRALLALRRWGIGLLGGVAAASARTPSATAIIDDDGSLTFRELWQRSDAVAAGLVRAGARPGDGIGLLARDHRSFVVWLLAGLKVGGRVVLVNTGFAAPEVAGVVADEGLGWLLHDQDSAAPTMALGAGTGSVVALDDAALDALASARGRVDPPTRAGELVILTSGTTGRPKGTARATDGVGLEAAAGVLGRLPLRACDTQVVAAPLFHAWGLSHLGVGLVRSATTIVSRRFDAGRTLAAVAAHRAEVLVVVPTMLARLLALDPDMLARADTSRLRVIASSGAALDPSLVVAAREVFGPVLHNLYGSTEVAAVSVARPRDLAVDPRTAGRPVPGVRVRIVDADGTRLPTGEVGRILVAPAGAAGAPVPTGDLGYLDVVGRLTVVGREDDMVVCGGENVYPSEVEAVLATHPAVAEVAVVGVPDTELGQALAAVIVVRAGHSLDAEVVRAHVGSQLARFKVPRTVRFVPALPRNATGKLLRRELRW